MTGSDIRIVSGILTLIRAAVARPAAKPASAAGKDRAALQLPRSEFIWEFVRSNRYLQQSRTLRGQSLQQSVSCLFQ